jgi:hypothetical protein
MKGATVRTVRKCTGCTPLYALYGLYYSIRHCISVQFPPLTIPMKRTTPRVTGVLIVLADDPELA